MSAYTIDNLLELVIERDASDLHLEVGSPPVLRLNGKLVPVDGPSLLREDTVKLMSEITSETHRREYDKKGSTDFGFDFIDKARFRVNIHRTRNNFGLCLRKIPKTIRPLNQTGLPRSIEELLNRKKGLILVTGPTGSGKTSSLAAMVDHINKTRESHIITIEDPIEYIYEPSKSLITQREVGADADSFPGALRSALRQDPDIILVGEMRDRETMNAALRAAETGHLVMGTLHTTGAVRTVDRVVNAFAAEARDEIRTELASSLLAVISQVLLPGVNGGRVLANEILVHTDAVGALIRDNKTFRLYSEMQTGSQLGMITMDVHLETLLSQGLIYPDDAIAHATYPEEMKCITQNMRTNTSIRR